ncbi:MAG TPA: PHP domain-containing protein [Edaphocola sp.]|nr:PHP domain-containing protein [Edaphocola sp.]
MTNREIAKHFELLSKIMDIHNEDSFRSKSYATAAYRIEKISEPLSEKKIDELKTIPTIGLSLAEKIFELTQTGNLKILEEYLQKTPKGVVDMLQIKGIGPKKISLLWKELNIESIGELEYACQENRLIGQKGFGLKTQASILANIKFIKANSGFCLYSEADNIVQLLTNLFENLFPESLYCPTGAYRQQQDVMDKIEWITTLNKEQVLNTFKEFNVEEIIDNENLLTLYIEGLAPIIFQFVNNETEFYLNLFKNSAGNAFIDTFEKDFTYPLNLSSEEEIFSENHLANIPPYLRIDDYYLKPAKENRLPEIIQTNDIKGIIHSHSTYSDGINSLEEMALATKEKGYEYLVISDHSQAAFYANGLTAERIKQQHQEIDRLNEQLAPFKIFKSIESDILYDGNLDYEEAVLNSFDLIIASVHSNLKMTEEKAMQRLLTAIQNPATRILGHPTGRLLLSREGYPIDHKTIIDACSEHNVVLEINAHPRRLDLDWIWIQYAIEKGVLLSIDPDAHSIDGIDLVKYGVIAAQKAALPTLNNLSSYSLEEFELFLKDRNYKK